MATIHTPEQVEARKAIYTEKFHPLVRQLHELAQEHGFYMNAAFQVAADEGGFHLSGSQYLVAGEACKDMYHAGYLMTGQVPREILALNILSGNGFTPPEEEQEAEQQQPETVTAESEGGDQD